MKKLEKEILCDVCAEYSLCFQHGDGIRNYCTALHDAKFKGREFYKVAYGKNEIILKECLKPLFI